ncbi:MAG: glycosyltransferase family 4 protein [Candidatus Hydrogenedentes bacterium]|nr:glycosyltransferase family 4 protein [Candidatus Hydrogenedentota bacterium]
MRVLHLFSNCKWTGPAEPALNMCIALRSQGITVDFACAPRAGSGFNEIVSVARAQHIEPLDFMRLYKHRNPIWNFLDARALRHYLGTTQYDLIHCHLDNDHEITLRATANLDIPVIRSNHFGTGLPNNRRHRILATRSSAIFEPSLEAEKSDAVNFNIEPERLFLIPGAVNTKRFTPKRPLPNMRSQIDIPEDAFLFGIVARMQTHRHYEDLFEAFRKLSDIADNAHLVVVGRGTRQQQVAFTPVKRLNLEDRVHFSGYLEKDAYTGLLHNFDVGLFLTPGTDGTCRASREIMAMGKPLIVADRGMLREIINDKAGIITDGSVEELYKAMLQLYQKPKLLQQLAKNAYETAHSRYTLEYQAKCIIAAYEKILLRT